MTVEECSKLKVSDFPASLLESRCESGAHVYHDESYSVIYARLIVRRVVDKAFPEVAAKRPAKADRSRGQAFNITRTACNYGGWRYWFVCPRCKRRCAILYSYGYPGYFLCRKCHYLTYTSTQEARKPVGYGALAMYLSRSTAIERKLGKIKRWRKRAYKLDAQLERLSARFGWMWRTAMGEF